MTDTPTSRRRVAADTDRAPASDPDAEQVVIGAMLTDGRVIPDVAAKLAVDDFYRPRHADLYAALLTAHEDGQPIEPVAFAGYLADRGDLARLGGASYLHDCVTAVPTASQVGHYAARVAELAERRRIEAAGVQIVQAATSTRTAEEISALAEKLIAESKPRRGALEMTQLGALINPCLDDIEVRRQRPAGITTGFTDLDRLLGGLRPKQLITVAGATGMGKSLLLLDLGRHIAIRLGLTVAMFSLEMAKEEIFDRILAAEAGVPHHLIRDGHLDDREWQKISGKLGPMSNAPLFIADDAPLGVRQMNARCQRLRQRHGLHVVIVDHMHLVDPSKRCEDERARLEDVSRGLKVNLAMDLDVPVIAAAQLNRNPHLRADKRPQLSDLKNSSSIEQDSNVVVLIHRPDYYDKASPRAGEADLIVDKNRNGAKDVVTVAAQLYKSRFVDMAVA